MTSLDIFSFARRLPADARRRDRVHRRRGGHEVQPAKRQPQTDRPVAQERRLHR